MNGDPQNEHRKSGIAAEKLAGVIISGAALAFAVYQSWMAFSAVVQRDIDSVVVQQSILEARLQSYYEQRSPWIDRIVELERKNSAIYDRLSSLAERVAACDKDDGKPGG